MYLTPSQRRLVGVDLSGNNVDQSSHIATQGILDSENLPDCTHKPSIRSNVNPFQLLASRISPKKKNRFLHCQIRDCLILLIGLPIEAVLEHVIEAPGLREWFEKAPEVGNPDALLLALKMRVKIYIDSEVFEKLLPNPYSSSKLFSASHLSTIANCLKESTFCQPRVHNVWPSLLDILLRNVILKDADSLQVFAHPIAATSSSSS